MGAVNEVKVEIRAKPRLALATILDLNPSVVDLMSVADDLDQATAGQNNLEFHPQMLLMVHVHQQPDKQPVILAASVSLKRR